MRVFGTPDGNKIRISMVNTGIGKVQRGWPRWEAILGSLVILSFISCSRLGHRLPMVVQDVGFLVVVATPLLLTAMSWAGFAKVRRDGNVSRWRIWISFCGCVALSLALVIPWIAFFFSMLLSLDWLPLATGVLPRAWFLCSPVSWVRNRCGFR
jgi:hypothetical protein